jgi:hypothetical protein
MVMAYSSAWAVEGLDDVEGPMVRRDLKARPPAVEKLGAGRVEPSGIVYNGAGLKDQGWIGSARCIDRCGRHAVHVGQNMRQPVDKKEKLIWKGNQGPLRGADGVHRQHLP